MYVCMYVCIDFQFSVCVYNLCVSKCFSTKIMIFFCIVKFARQNNFFFHIIAKVLKFFFEQSV